MAKKTKQMTRDEAEDAVASAFSDAGAKKYGYGSDGSYAPTDPFAGGGFNGGAFINNATFGLLGGLNNPNTFQATAPTIQQNDWSGGMNQAQQQSNSVYGQQGNLAQTLSDQASGKGPSLAQQQLQQATNANISGAASQAASARGLNPAQAARQAGMNQSNMQQQAAGQSAMTRLQEQNSKQQQLATVLAQQRAGSEQMYGADVSGFGAQNSALTQGQLGAENINSQTAQANNKQQQGLLGGLLGGLGGGAQYAEGGGVGDALMAHYDEGTLSSPVDPSVDPTPIKLSPMETLPGMYTDKSRTIDPSELGNFPTVVQSGLNQSPVGSRLSESGYSTQLPQGYPRNQPMDYLPGMTTQQGMLSGDMPHGTANAASWDQFNQYSDASKNTLTPYKMDAQDQQAQTDKKDAGKQGNFWLNMLVKLGAFAAMRPYGNSVTPRPYDDGGYVDEKPSDYAMNIPQGAPSAPAPSPSSNKDSGNSGMQGLSSLMSLVSMLDSGGEVPGHARYPGNDLRNDIEPAILSKKEIVLPRTVTLADDAPDRAAEFTAALKHHQGKVADPAAQYHADMDELDARLSRLESLLKRG
jgi:hypothetical protein